MNLRSLWSRLCPPWQQPLPERGVHVLGTTMADGYEPPSASLIPPHLHPGGITVAEALEGCRRGAEMIRNATLRLDDPGPAPTRETR